MCERLSERNKEMVSAGNQSAAAQKLIDGTYERNPINNFAFDKDFEINVAIYSLLTLPQNDQNAIAFEYKWTPAKFDDVVLRVQNVSDYSYCYRQLKHKDTQKNTDAYLTWNDLLKTKKSPRGSKPPFGIPYYYECFLAQPNNKVTLLNDTKELAFVTNYNLVKKGASSVNNLEELTQRLLYASTREPKHHITEIDLVNFFIEWNDPSSWRPPSSNQKSYKLNEKAIKQILKGTQAGLNAANKQLDLTSYDAFLRLLVFHVSMPHVNELKKINQNLLKVFLPFHKNVLSEKYGYITEKLIGLFETRTIATANMVGQNNATSRQAKWASFECRRLLFEQMATEWSVEDSTDFATTFGLANNQMMQPWDFIATELLETKTKWEERSPMKVVNIFNPHSNPSITTLKVLNTLQNTSLQLKIMTTQVTDKKSHDDTIEYFEQLDKEVSPFVELVCENFCCIIIAILPAGEGLEMAFKQTVQRLIAMQILRKWIRFVIITHKPIILEWQRHLDFERIQDTSLNWGDLSAGYKKFLIEKTLHVDNNQVTNLRALGFEQDTIGEWLHPRALAELIIHDDKKKLPISLYMSKRETNFESDHLEQEIQLPLVTKSVAAQREEFLTCNKTDFGSYVTAIIRKVRVSLEKLTCAIEDEENVLVSLGSPVTDHKISNLVIVIVDRNDKQYVALFTKCPENKYFISPVTSRSYENPCLLVNARNNRSIFELNFVRSTNSDDTVQHDADTQLLEYDASFDTGSTDNKLLGIIDLPGKRVPSLLTSLRNRFLDDCSSISSTCLLLRVNLREIKQWEKWGSGIEFLLSHSDIFKRDLMIENASLTAAIVNRKCTSGPPSVFVLLDGYDEINDEQRKTITLDAIGNLKKMKGIKRIIFTSRPEAVLESVVEQRFHQLLLLRSKNFDRGTYIRYLTRQWTSKVEKLKSKNKFVGKIEKYAQSLVNFAGGTLHDKSALFLYMPCFFQQLVQHLESNIETVPEFDEERFKILSHYDRFFEAKIGVLFQEKANIPPHRDSEALYFLRNEMKERFLKSLRDARMLNNNNSTINTTMLWYFLVSDMIRSYMSDTDDIRAREIQNVFFTEISQQKSLTAYAHATCCCQCKSYWEFTEFGIRFPRDEELNTDSRVGPLFRRLFADKLEFLWNNGEAETQFIDFLFKGYEFAMEDEREHERSNEVQNTGFSQSIELREAESARLRTIHLSKLSYLLFSDVVAEYIPKKLSPAGLNHPINTLKSVPLLISSCERNCFRINKLKFVPDTKILRMSILDGIIQEDVITSPRMCKSKKNAGRIKALQEKLQETCTVQQLSLELRLLLSRGPIKNENTPGFAKNTSHNYLDEGIIANDLMENSGDLPDDFHNVETPQQELNGQHNNLFSLPATSVDSSYDNERCANTMNRKNLTKKTYYWPDWLFSALIAYQFLMLIVCNVLKQLNFKLTINRYVRLYKPATFNQIRVCILLMCCLLVSAPENNPFNCTEKPIIEHANILPHSNNTFLHYACNQGFQMVNHRMEPSSGTFRCSDNLEWLPQPLPLCVPYESIEIPDKKKPGEDEPHDCKCPHEEFKGIKVSEVVSGGTVQKDRLEPANHGYNIGDVLVLTCNNVSYAGDKSHQTIAKPKNFIVYPSTVRTCQPDCTWSGPPPVCLMQQHSAPVPFDKVLTVNAVDCSKGDCFERTEKWKEVGSYFNSTYPSATMSRRNYTRTWLVEFRRHVHLSFVTVKKVDPASGAPLGRIDVRLKVNPGDEVQILSNDSRSINDPKNSDFSRGNENAIISIAPSYTREILVSVFADLTLTSNWNPRLEFYAASTQGIKGLDGDSCPSPPSIPHAVMVPTADGRHVQYYCEPGYHLKDPMLNTVSDGKISCNKDEFGWSPYPFPVCKYHGINSSSDSSGMAGSFPYVTDLPKTSTHDLTPTNEGIEYHSTLILNKLTEHGKANELVESYLPAMIVAVILVCMAFFSITFAILTYRKYRDLQKNQHLQNEYQQIVHVYDYPVLPTTSENKTNNASPHYSLV